MLMDSKIHRTLTTYLISNEDVLSDTEKLDLKEQIDYMAKRIANKNKLFKNLFKRT